MGVRDGVAEMFEPEDEEPRYRRGSDIGRSDLFEALRPLAGFSENPFLVMQASQLCHVDNLLNGLEEQVLQQMIEDDPPRSIIAMVRALSPIFAAYELLRAWRQRCEEILKLTENGGFDQKATHLERELGYRHYDRELRAQQLRDAQERP